MLLSKVNLLSIPLHSLSVIESSQSYITSQRMNSTTSCLCSSKQDLCRTETPCRDIKRLNSKPPILLVDTFPRQTPCLLPVCRTVILYCTRWIASVDMCRDYRRIPGQSVAPSLSTPRMSSLKSLTSVRPTKVCDPKIQIQLFSSSVDGTSGLVAGTH